MLTTVQATVTALLRVGAGVVELEARADGEASVRRGVAYPDLTGPVGVGDRVRLNTTATTLGLGTGGVDFVVAVERAQPATFGPATGDEHIVKLRYTPHQHAVSVCEMNPAFADVWAGADTLGQTPVVVCGLHSQVGAVAAGVKAARPGARVAYLMTDWAALPLAFSQSVPQLLDLGLLDTTLTCGQAWGGAWECVSLPSALLAAVHLARADVVVVAQGPGNAGTGTQFGWSGIEQGAALDTVGLLDGAAIGVLRLSLADPRPRHRGLSHHSVIALGKLSSGGATVAFPARNAAFAEEWLAVRGAALASPIADRHRIVEKDGAAGMALLGARGVAARSMGRGVDDDPLFFHAAAAAGAVAAEGMGG